MGCAAGTACAGSAYVGWQCVAIPKLGEPCNGYGECANPAGRDLAYCKNKICTKVAVTMAIPGQTAFTCGGGALPVCTPCAPRAVSGRYGCTH